MPASPIVRRWATVLNVLALVAFGILILALGLGALFADLPSDLRAAAGIPEDTDLSPLRRIAVAAISALPTLAMLYVLWQMHGLFTRYAKGETLSAACAGHIGRIGVGLLASAVLEVITRPAAIAVASLVNPPGSRVLAISLTSPDLALVLAGGLMLCIGWVMRDAARIAEDNAGFV